MPTVEESIIIDKPRDEVYAYASDSNHALEWNTVLVEYEATPPGVVTADTVSHGVSRVAGRNIEWKAKVTNLQEGALTEWESTESPMAFTYSWGYEDADGGTKVTFRQDVPSIGGFFGKLADPIVTRMYARSFRTNLENLKEILENQG